MINDQLGLNILFSLYNASPHLHPLKLKQQKEFENTTLVQIKQELFTLKKDGHVDLSLYPNDNSDLVIIFCQISKEGKSNVEHITKDILDDPDWMTDDESYEKNMKEFEKIKNLSTIQEQVDQLHSFIINERDGTFYFDWGMTPLRPDRYDYLKI